MKSLNSDVYNCLNPVLNDALSLIAARQENQLV